VVSAPVRRCLQTAAIVCKELGLAQIVADNRLGEDLAAVARCNPEGKPFSYLSRQEADAAIAQYAGGVGLA
jgi:broad specificity phosphatase PhoE